MRRAVLCLSTTALIFIAASHYLIARPITLVRVQNRSNPLLGAWVSTDLSQSAAVNARRAELIFGSDFTQTAITTLVDGRVSRRMSRYGIEHVDRPDEGYVWLFGNRDGLETKTRYEFRIYNGQLYLQSPGTGLMVFKRKGR